MIFSYLSNVTWHGLAKGYYELGNTWMEGLNTPQNASSEDSSLQSPVDIWTRELPITIQECSCSATIQVKS